MVLELTEEFIKRHQMAWPVAFSGKSVFDQRYGVRGIPTFALIDKKGIVRYIQVGSGNEGTLRRIVNKLLDEAS